MQNSINLWDYQTKRHKNNYILLPLHFPPPLVLSSFCWFHLILQDSFHERLEEYRMNLPVLCKPVLAHGAESAHQMDIICTPSGIPSISPPIIIQEFIEHDAFLIKVFKYYFYFFIFWNICLSSVARHSLVMKPTFARDYTCCFCVKETHMHDIFLFFLLLLGRGAITWELLFYLYDEALVLVWFSSVIWNQSYFWKYNWR